MTTPFPELIDNQQGNTLAKAICGHLQALRRAGAVPEEVSIATAYFNPGGFRLIARELEDVPRIRLLLGAEPVPEPLLTRRSPFDAPPARFFLGKVRAALQQQDQWLREARNRLGFDAEEDERLHTLLHFLRSGRIEVRRYEKNFLHAKAYLFRGAARGALTGSSNFTRAGLSHNLELNLGHTNEPLPERLEEWYDRLWEEAVPYDLAALYEALFLEFSPHDIFLMVLWHLYHGELQTEQEETGSIHLTNFQKHGVWRALHILEKYGGVLVADSVGLGKTFTAGEIIRIYRERRQRVLLVCPAALRDTTWERFLNRYQLLVECVSYEELAGDTQLGGRHAKLKNPLDDYALVVIDEAHNYRNPDAPQRARVLRRLLSGQRRDLLLLSATPVNNSLWDLYHLLRYFMKQDAELSGLGISSIRGRFHEAMQVDPSNLSPDLLYPVIDATTVKRTRKFVSQHYQGDSLRGPDGTLMHIVFPKPIATTIKYDLEAVLPGFLARLEEILMPPAPKKPLLTMARYQPDNYELGQPPGAEDSALVGLLRSALLKRFESSARAFCLTLKRMIEHHEAFLEALGHGKVLQPDFFREVAANEDEWDVKDYLDHPDYTEPLSNYQQPGLQDAVENDLDLLKEMHQQAVKLKQATDPKLQALVAELIRIAKQAKKEGLDRQDESQKRKVLIFSYYGDTVDWIEEFLSNALQRRSELQVYQNRLASVSGQSVRNGVSREEAVWGFAPVSTEAPPGNQQDRFDILLCTDVLAEGMNLQQCRHIINYDLPWNPMRLVQRHGRIDRIGSPHKRVFLRTFFPDQQLDQMLRLEERVRSKLAQAAASIGVETPPIQHGASGEQSFAETRAEIEKLLQEDATIFEQGGTAGAAQTGEEYRQMLRKGLQEQGDRLANLPWRIGSGMRKGSVSGSFFLAAVGERYFLRFVSHVGHGQSPLAQPTQDAGSPVGWAKQRVPNTSSDVASVGHGQSPLAQPTQDAGSPVGWAKQRVPNNPEGIVREWGTCLRLIECSEDTPIRMTPEMVNAAYRHWEEARADIHQEWMRDTETLNLQLPLRPLNRKIAAFLREHPPAEVEQVRLERCLDAVESPISLREERELREVFASVDEGQVSPQALIEAVENLGLEPFKPPKPLPPIEPDEIHLICWMGIEAQQSTAP